ncbi:hypothetical protein ABPG72_022208 [Tetrahymena utriculariae]
MASMAQQDCDLGCNICSSKQFNNKNIQCKQCYDGYLLDNGSCIYQGCQPNLYLQTQICVKLTKCTINFSTQINTFYQDTLLEFLIYQEQQNDLGMVKQLNYQDDDLTISNVNELIIALKQDFSINIWDSINENRNNNYILINNVESDNTQFQVIFDQIKQQQLVSNIIQINESFEYIQIFNNILFMGNETNLFVYQVTFQPLRNSLTFNNPLVFTFANQGQLIQMVQMQNSSSYFSIYNNCILQIDINEQKQDQSQLLKKNFHVNANLKIQNNSDHESLKTPLGSIYNQKDNSIKLYGLHKNGVFENNYAISMYDNDQQKNFTDEIFECNPQIESCEAENFSSINYCKVGYIGPICQECDVLGEVWHGIRYSQSTKIGECSQCSRLSFHYIYRQEQSKDQGILNFMNDFILEQSDYNEALEELDPKKVQNYSFTAKSSIFNYQQNNLSIL